MNGCGIISCLMTTREVINSLCTCYVCHFIKKKSRSASELASPSDDRGVNYKITPRSSVYINVKKVENI